MLSFLKTLLSKPYIFSHISYSCVRSIPNRCGSSEFRETGLLLFINQILHVFGWAIVFEIDGDSGKVTNVYPARVKYRGFDNESVSESYLNITKYLNKNVSELLDEAND